ncbi:MAG: hypothetical protein ACI4VQ_01710 [Clostridia bacterium]
MKSNKGMGLISLIIIIAIIVGIVAVSIYFVRLKYNEIRVETIKTDMLQVQWKVKKYMDDQIVNGEEKQYLGTKIIDMQEDIIVKDFLTKGIISEEEYEKYYILKDEELAQATLEITNYEGSYYLINYETYEVIVTQGCKYSDGEVLYKLTDIENKTNSLENNVENELIYVEENQNELLDAEENEE